MGEVREPPRHHIGFMLSERCDCRLANRVRRLILCDVDIGYN